MSGYQNLLDRAIALVNADRGFVVLCDPATGMPIQIVAAHEFASALVFQPFDSVSKDYQVIQNALPVMAKKNQPLLVNNLEPEYFTLGRYEGVQLTRSIRTVIVVPLRNAVGLLWCDATMLPLKPDLIGNRPMKPFQPHELEQLIALTEESD